MLDLTNSRDPFWRAWTSSGLRSANLTWPKLHIAFSPSHSEYFLGSLRMGKMIPASIELACLAASAFPPAMSVRFSIMSSLRYSSSFFPLAPGFWLVRKACRLVKNWLWARSKPVASRPG